MKRLQQAIEGHIRLHADMTGEMERWQDEIAELKREKEAKAQELMIQSQEIQALRQNIEEKEQEIQAKAQAIEDYQDKVEQQDRQLDSLKKPAKSGEAAKSDEVRALEEKLQHRDEELKRLRQQATGSLVPLQTSLKYDDVPRGTDPRVEIAKLKQALEIKDRKIESLQVQVQSFEGVIKHTKEQSKQVLKLKQELKTVQVSCSSIACCPYRLTCYCCMCVVLVAGGGLKPLP